jgi:hypothetical protein
LSSELPRGMPKSHRGVADLEVPGLGGALDVKVSAAWT